MALPHPAEAATQISAGSAEGLVEEPREDLAAAPAEDGTVAGAPDVDADDEVEDLDDDIEELDDLEEVEEAAPSVAAAPVRAQTVTAPPPRRAQSVMAPPLPPRPPRAPTASAIPAAVPPIPPASAPRRAATVDASAMDVPRRAATVDASLLGTSDSGKVDLLRDQSGLLGVPGAGGRDQSGLLSVPGSGGRDQSGLLGIPGAGGRDQSGLLRVPGSGPVTAAATIELPARLEIASPSALDQAQSLAREDRAPWATREAELVARFEAASDLQTAAVLAYELGELRERHLGDSDGALAAHRQALDADPSLRSNLWALHRLLRHNGQWEELVDVLDTAALAASTDQERAQIHLEKAHVLEIRLEAPTRARDAYEQAAAFDPSLIAAHRGLERLALAAGDHDALARALEALAAAMDEPAHALICLLDLARLAGERGDFAGAREALDRATALGVERTRVARERLRLAEQAEDFEEMLAALEAQIQEVDAHMHTGQGAEDGRAVQIAALRRQQALVARDRLSDPERAWTFLQDALTRAPGEPVVLADLADLAERVGRFEELAALFQGIEALSGGTRSLALSLRRADALLRSGHRSEARALLDAMARELPGYLPVLALRERDALQAQDWPALARAHLEAGMHPGRLFDPEAVPEAVSDGVSDASPETAAGAGAGTEQDRVTAAVAAVCAGHVLTWLCNDPAAAEAAFTQALAQVPGHGPAVEALLALHEHGGRLDAAAALLAQHAATGSEAERMHRLERLARIYRELGQTDRVLDAERRLLALAPTGAERTSLLWRIEGTLAALGRTRERVDVLIELAEVMDLSGQRAQALRMAARACEALADTAIADRATVGEEQPGAGLGAAEDDDSRAWAARAADLYRQVLELSPGDRYAQSALVALLRRSGRWDDLWLARRAEAELLPDGPALARALREAGSILRDELGQPAAAAAVYRDLLDRMPGHPGAMQELAEALAQAGEIDELVDALELESVTADAPRAQILATLRLGLALERAGRRDQATAAYRRVLDMAPDAAVAATLELGIAPALAAAAVIELADPVTEGSARVEALERLAESTGQGALGSALLEDAGWRWLVEADAVERAQDAFERAERWASGTGADNPGALLGLALLHARHGDAGAAGAALERLAEAVPTPTVRAALLLRAAALAEAGGDHALVARRIAAAVAATPEEPGTVVTAAEYPAPGLLAISGPLSDTAPMSGVADGPDGSALDLAALEAQAELMGMRAALAGDAARDDWELDRAEVLEVAGRLGEAARITGAVLATHPGHVRAIELLRRVCRRAGDRAGLARASLALAREMPGAASRMELLREAAAIFDRDLGDAPTAMWIYRRILAEEPGAPEFERALDICRAESDVRAQIELLTARLSWLSRQPPAERQATRAEVPLFLERARLRRALGDGRGAERDLALLLAIDGQHAAAWAARAEVAEDLDMAEQAAEHWRRYLAVETDADHRAAAERTLARLLAERLDDPEGALTQLEQVVRHSPDDLEVRERLLALLVRTESWPRAVRELGEIEKRRKDARPRARDHLRMAEILRDRIGDRQGAIDALNTARNLDPADLEVIRTLADLTAPARRVQVLRLGARDLRAAVAAQPAQVTLYTSLAELAGWQEDDEARFFAACALSLLGEVPAAQREILAQVGAALAEGRAPSGVIGSEELAKHLLAIRDEGAHWAADIWACIAEAVTKSLALEPSALGFGRGERIAAKHLDRQYPAAAAAARAFAILDEGEVYVSENKPGHARALSFERPVVCLGADVARGDSPGARFALGRCMTLARLGAGTAVALDDAELQRFFAAAAQVVGASDLPASLAAVASDDALAAAVRNLQKHLSRRDRKQLTGMTDRVSKIDVPSWRRAIERTATRGGVLLTADLRGLGALLAPAGSGAVDRDDPDVLDLLAWMVGDDHLSLRRHLGLTHAS